MEWVKFNSHVATAVLQITTRMYTKMMVFIMVGEIKHLHINFGVFVSIL